MSKYGQIYSQKHECMTSIGHQSDWDSGVSRYTSGVVHHVEKDTSVQSSRRQPNLNLGDGSVLNHLHHHALEPKGIQSDMPYRSSRPTTHFTSITDVVVKINTTNPPLLL
jgi:hypothetical protein